MKATVKIIVMQHTASMHIWNIVVLGLIVPRAKVK